MTDSRGVLLTAVVAASLVGGMSGYAAARWQGPELDLRARPRIAVVSYADSLEDKTADQVAATMAALDAKARRLSAAGFVVLDDNAVVASPADLFVPSGTDNE